MSIFCSRRPLDLSASWTIIFSINSLRSAAENPATTSAHARKVYTWQMWYLSLPPCPLSRANSLSAFSSPLNRIRIELYLHLITVLFFYLQYVRIPWHRGLKNYYWHVVVWAFMPFMFRWLGGMLAHPFFSQLLWQLEFCIKKLPAILWQIFLCLKMDKYFGRFAAILCG